MPDESAAAYGAHVRYVGIKLRCEPSERTFCIAEPRRVLGGLSLARQVLCASCFPPTHSPATLTLYQNPSPPSHPTSRIGSRCSGCQQRSQRRPGLFSSERGQHLLRANSTMCWCVHICSGVVRIHCCLASIVLRFVAFLSLQKSMLSRFVCS